MAFLRRRGRAPAPRLRPRRARGVRASRSRRARSSPRSCATTAAAARAATARSRCATTTRTSSSWSPRAATSTSTRSARRSGTPPTARRPSRAARSSSIREADRLSPRRGRHAAEGARGAAARHRVPAAVGAGARAARHGPAAGATSSTSRRCPRRSSSQELEGEGVDRTRARLAARLSGGNLGRARRMATDRRRAGVPRRRRASALAAAAAGPAGALAAADRRAGRRGRVQEGTARPSSTTELAPFLDEKGRPEDAYRGAIRRIETRFARRERRAERDQSTGSCWPPRRCCATGSRPRCRRRPACG